MSKELANIAANHLLSQADAYRRAAEQMKSSADECSALGYAIMQADPATLPTHLTVPEDFIRAVKDRLEFGELPDDSK